jgi:hypothetical protein
MSRSNNGNVGRHDGLARVPEPAAGFSPLPTSTQNSRASIAIVAVPDAYEPQKRVRALCRVDLLDTERRSGKIDEASFLVGRECEVIFERMNRISGAGQWGEGDRTDFATAAECYTLLGLESAVKVNAFLNWVHRHVGTMDTLLLWRILGCRMSITATAVSFGRDSRRGHRYVHDRFVDALAALANAKAAKGAQVRR